MTMHGFSNILPQCKSNGSWIPVLLILCAACASEPNLADLKKQVDLLSEQETARQQQEQKIQDRLAAIESQLDEHDFLVGELIKTEEEASLDTRNLLDKLERMSARLREQIEKTRTSTRQRDQDLLIRLKAIEARMENVVHQRRSSSPTPVKEQPSTPESEPTKPETPSSASDPHVNGQKGKPPNQATVFRSAYKAYLNEQYDLASTEFQRFVARFPQASLTPQAYYYLGDSYYIQKRYDEATAALQHIISRYPTNKYVPPALFKLGLVMMETDRVSEAQELWDRVVEEYPDSSEASLAKDQLAKAQAAP